MAEHDGTGPKRVCFMVMPYGERDTGTDRADAPKRVDFNRLWEEAYRPALLDLGYEPVRADMDLGALIIKEMLERLVIAHVVVADVSIPNGNVYYEIGVRHAAKQDGCVLVAADWAKPLFDIDQMPRLVYPLSDGRVGKAAAKVVRETLVQQLPAMIEGTSPVFQAVDGYPEPEPAAAESFKDFVRELTDLQGKMQAVRGAPPSKRADRARQLVDEVWRKVEPPTSVALELLFLLRDVAGWEETREYIERLPKPIRELSTVREQLALAQSKAGDHDEAIAGLEALIRHSGESSERLGLIGGRYKKLVRDAGSEEDRSFYLDKAIESYQRGADLDLNDYFPASNLARLYRTRGAAGDEELARTAATITLAAVRRAMERDPNDEWIRPTLLGAAFDDGNVEEASRLCDEIRRDGADRWKLDTTLDDLHASIQLIPDSSTQARLLELHDMLVGFVS